MLGRYLVAGARGILSMEPEPSNPAYSMFNTGGVEVEVGEFLYGLVRIVKPDRILETGTHWGISATFMGLALKENQKGNLTTIDFLEGNSRTAQRLFNTLGLSDYIEVVTSHVEKWSPGDTQYDIILLDTEPQTRFTELIRFWPNLKPGGIVIIHDLHIHMGQVGATFHNMLNWPFGVLPREIKELIKSHALQSLHIRTPRGFYLAQKAASDFYSTRLLRGEEI